MRAEQVNTVGILLAITGIIFFSSKAVLIKLAYQYGVSSTHFLLFRMSFAFPIYALIAMRKSPKNPELIQSKDYLWLIGLGIIGFYLAALLDFIGLLYIKASLERIILFIYPTIVVFLSWLFFKTRITGPQIIAIIVTYIGIMITFWGDLGGVTEETLYGGFMIILCAFSYAAYLVGSGKLIPKFGVWIFTAYAMIVSTISIVIQYLIFDRGDLIHYPWQVYALGIAMALFATLIPSFLVSAAIEKIGASNFSILGSLGPISTIILAYFFLEEQLTLWQWLGTVVVIFGVIIVSKKKKIKSKTST